MTYTIYRSGPTRTDEFLHPKCRALPTWPRSVKSYKRYLCRMFLKLLRYLIKNLSTLLILAILKLKYVESLRYHMVDKPQMLSNKGCLNLTFLLNPSVFILVLNVIVPYVEKNLKHIMVLVVRKLHVHIHVPIPIFVQVLITGCIKNLLHTEQYVFLIGLKSVFFAMKVGL